MRVHTALQRFFTILFFYQIHAGGADMGGEEGRQGPLESFEQQKQVNFQLTQNQVLRHLLLMVSCDLTPESVLDSL